MSGGQRQRVLVARALARRPRLLCVDEPLNNLDLPTERALLNLFARRREAGTAIVFVTHNVSIAAHLATHVALVRDGGAEVGPAAEILRPDRLERAYGGPVAIVPIPGLAATPAGAASAAEAAS
jgi:ABC-type Mn2+/Zn2+ transport system ATPase subunit